MYSEKAKTFSQNPFQLVDILTFNSLIGIRLRYLLMETLKLLAHIANVQVSEHQSSTSVSWPLSCARAGPRVTRNKFSKS